MTDAEKQKRIDQLDLTLALYRMVDSSIYLALRCLQAGNVSGLDQSAFWNAHAELSGFCDLPLEVGDPDAPTSGLAARIERMQDELIALIDTETD